MDIWYYNHDYWVAFELKQWTFMQIHLCSSHSFFFFFFAIVLALVAASYSVSRHAGMFAEVWCNLDRLPGEHGSTTLDLSVHEPVSQMVLGKAEERHGEGSEQRKRPPWMLLRQVFPPVNHSPQSCSNDARFLKRFAGWKRVKIGLMSHTEGRPCQLPYIAWSLRKVDLKSIELRKGCITGVNKSSITGSLWEVLIPD